MSSKQCNCSTPYKETPQYLHIVIGAVLVFLLIFVMQYILYESILIPLIVFNIIFLLFTFPLNGPLWCKIIWVMVGNVVGILFGLIRLSFSLALGADYYGIDFFLSRVIDFIWIVPIWSLALSSLNMMKHRKKNIGGL